MKQAMNRIVIDFNYLLGDETPTGMAGVGITFTDTCGKEILEWQEDTAELTGNYQISPLTKEELINRTLEKIREFMRESFRGEHEGTRNPDERVF